MTTCKKALLLVTLAVTLPGCNVRQAQSIWLMKQSNAKCKDAADLLAGVKDAASAKAAAPRLKKLMEEMDKINEELERVYDPTDVDPADEKAVTEQTAEGIVQMQRLFAEVARIGKEPEIKSALGDAWQRLSGMDVIIQGGVGME